MNECINKITYKQMLINTEATKQDVFLFSCSDKPPVVGNL